MVFLLCFVKAQFASTENTTFFASDFNGDRTKGCGERGQNCFFPVDLQAKVLCYSWLQNAAMTGVWTP